MAEQFFLLVRAVLGEFTDSSGSGNHCYYYRRNPRTEYHRSDGHVWEPRVPAIHSRVLVLGKRCHPIARGEGGHERTNHFRPCLPHRQMAETGGVDPTGSSFRLVPTGLCVRPNPVTFVFSNTKRKEKKGPGTAGIATARRNRRVGPCETGSPLNPTAEISFLCPGCFFFVSPMTNADPDRGTAIGNSDRFPIIDVVFRDRGNPTTDGTTTPEP